MFVRPIPALVVLSAACAPSTPPQAADPEVIVDTLVVVDTVTVANTADEELQERASRLQLQLLEKDAQLAEMQGQLDAARQEVVRNMAKLQSQASRAEAASGMAEAEIALQTLTSMRGGRSLLEHARATEYLAQSTAQFNEENYAGALYLATEARALASSAQGRLRGTGGEGLRAGETLFAIPVPLRTTRRSNVRAGPGLNFAIQYTLDGGLAVTGQSYTSEWVRVSDSQGREGWIFHTLVTNR